MNRFRINESGHARQRGVTLVELMISLLLGLLLTAGIIQVFVGNRVTYAFNDGLSRIQENARFSLDHIAYHARMAGYKGCISDIAIHNNLQTGTDIDFAVDLENGIQGYEAGGAGSWTPGLPSQLTGLPANNGRPIDDSDVLIVRGVSSTANALVSPFTNAASLFVSVPHDFVIGDLLVATDCQKASIFQVTNLNDDGETVVHANSSFYPGNLLPNWGSEQDYGLGAELARLQAYAFYVGGTANGPALFQLRLRGSASSEFVAEELAAGIDTMQVRYGVDIGNDGAIDRWDTANAVVDWENVLSVEVSLLARSEEYGAERDTTTYDLGADTFDGPNDRRLRQVFSTTIGVRNRLP
jgi:type IV pilus assembly protein PilW